MIPDGLGFLSFGGSLTDVDGGLTDPRTDAVYRLDEDTREFVMMEYRFVGLMVNAENSCAMIIFGTT